MDIYTGNHHNQHTDSVSMGLFLDMCPAILDQLIHGATDCWRLSTEPHLTTPAAIPTFSVSKTTISNETLSKNTSRKSKENSYIFGSLSTLVISLFSMFGAVFMKLTRVNIRAYLMAFMLSLAVGCLVADAGLHLLPEILAEEKEEENDGEHDELLAAPLKKMCAFLASIYAFFILELMLSTKHEHSHSDQNGTVAEQQRNKLNNLEQDGSQRSVTHHSPVLSAKQTNQTHQGQPQACGRTSSLDDPRCNSVSAANSNASDRISVHDTPSNIKALAWMIIIGDGIHNFADGLAIGAAYAVTFTKGLSISITVLCHEVPHELGDFAVLISTGMSIKKALVLNFLSSLTAFAGLYIGLALGAQEETSKWIFSVGAGMFLYVALTDLIPECKEIYKKTPTVKMFVTENLGLLFGFATMLLLAMYEDSMKIDI
ncbi:zinc transporter ZIP12-like isoform X2 [Dreissena polymorpha]|uniref:zinc transporter ZIP12-like isoform X2 n=1 Tax=Dreissena polymorpha TaxID=45954 RepID=UPI00226438A4|nr:zinc transporter ZIP12-like isoform X2 [Dreissena polymorpha]